MEKFYYIFSFICFVFSVYLSGGRGALIFTVITLCIAIAIKYGKKGIYIGGIIILFFTIFAYFAYNNPVINRRLHELANESYSNSMSSIGTRIALWKASYRIFLDHPIFGIGYGNFRNVIKNYLDVPVLTTAHAHNAYIQYLVLHGVIGLIALLFFFYKINKKLISCVKEDVIAISGLSIFIVFLLQGLIENNFYDSEVSMIFWFIIGSVTGMIENKEKA